MLSKKEVKDCFAAVADAESGLLSVQELHKAVSAVGLNASGRELVLIQGALRELYEGGDIEDGIPLGLFCAWYKLEVTPGHYEKHNELLVRRVIGKVKLPTRNLKDNQFVYGQRNIADSEGAGEVVLNWVPGKLSQSQETGVCLIKVNKAAVKQKLLTPKQVNQFLRENKNAPHLQRPKIVGRKKARGPAKRLSLDGHLGKSEFVAHEPMQKIIFPEDRTEVDRGGDHYVNTTGQVKKGRLPKPRPTKCSDMLRAHTRADQEQKQSTVEPWKMPRFQKNAEPRIHVQGKGKGKPRAQAQVPVATAEE